MGSLTPDAGSRTACDAVADPERGVADCIDGVADPVRALPDRVRRWDTRRQKESRPKAACWVRQGGSARRERHRHRGRRGRRDRCG